MLKVQGLPHPKLGPIGQELYQNVRDALVAYQSLNPNTALLSEEELTTKWLEYAILADLFVVFLRMESSEGRHTENNPTK